jgi:acetyl esterase/lipase
MKHLIIFLLLIIAPIGLVGAQDGDVTLTRNIAYSEDSRHRLDVYAPDGVENFPVVMYVSGGGWTSGSKDWIANLGMAIASGGIGVVTVDHRLVPTVTIAEQAEDLALAFAWIVENIADYGGDPARIVVGGHSAGGHLTSLMAMDAHYLESVGHSTQDIAGILPISGVLDVGDDMGAGLSPTEYFRADLPPFLLLVAAGDSSRIAASASVFEAQLNALDVPARREIIAGRDHFSIMRNIGQPDDEATRLIFEWLTELFDNSEGNADE